MRSLPAAFTLALVASMLSPHATGAITPPQTVTQIERSAAPREAGSFVPGGFVSTQSVPIDLQTSGPNANRTLDHVVITAEPQGDPIEQAATLSADLGFEVVPMILYQLMDEPSGEPLFDEQWSLENTGQTGGVPGADIDARSAWRWTLGSGSVIAIVDSGVDAAHPEIDGSLWINTGEIPANDRDDDANGFVDDVNGWDFASGDADPADTAGHGTAVAAIAAADVDGVGMAGVAPGARVMSVRACDAFGCPASMVAAAIVYAADNGAHVVNLSLGAPGVDPLVTAAVEYAAEQDVLVVAAAGNGSQLIDDTNPWTPASIEASNLLAVASTTASDQLSASSNYGPDAIDIGAPGDQIITAASPDGYETRGGTSFAAPHAAGVAALMRTLDPDISAEESATLMRLHSTGLVSLTSMVASGGRLDARVSTQAARFRDIPASEFADDVMWAATAGVTNGCRENLFCPDAVVSRGQMAAFLRRMLDLPLGDTDAFEDDDSSIFEADIDAIASAGITAGCTSTRFCPGDPITRGQMAAFLARAFDVPTSNVDAFSDDDGSVFEDDIDAIAAAGITRGCDPPANGAYCPEAHVTRGQMVALLRRTDA